MEILQWGLSIRFALASPYYKVVRAMKNRKFRNKPFCWQEKYVLRLIYDYFKRKSRKSALALYLVLTEISSNQGKEATLKTSIDHLRKKAGLHPNTIKAILSKFRQLDIIFSEQERTKTGTFGDLIITLLTKDEPNRSSEPKHKLPPRLNGRRLKTTIEDNYNKEINYKNILRSKKDLLKKRNKIIFLYASKKEIDLEGSGKRQSFIRRNLRPAKNLVPYELKKIEEVMNYLEANPEVRGNQRWTLETIGRFIDEPSLKKDYLGKAYKTWRPPE